MNIEIKEKELFDEWRKICPNLCEDGIVNPELYSKSKRKILFLLKEVNSDDIFSLKNFVKNGGRTQTWDNIAKWTYGILNLEKDFSWNELDYINDDESRKDILGSIAIININKIPGGHTANLKSLWKGTFDGREFLNRQFSLYIENDEFRPDMIVSCGSVTANYFHEIVPFGKDTPWEKTRRGVSYYKFGNEKLFIKYAHPEARVSDNLLYYGLVDAVKELS